MLLTDVNGPRSLKPRRTGSGRVARPIRFAAPAILFLSFATFGATILRAQDQQDQSVAEAARQERARKQELQKRAKHVYTEEDLKHLSILTPEDRAQVEAKRNECAQKNNCSPATPQNSPATLDANSPVPGSSLGEVARQLRKQKELQALKPKQSEPFHLPFSTPALASPILPEHPAIRPPAQPVLRSKTSSPRTPSNIFRRDPFAPSPVRPDVRTAEVRHPEIRPSVRENIRPEVHTEVHATARKNIRPTVQPKVSSDTHPKVREAIIPIIRPNVHPDFSKEVRPTLRAHSRLIAPAVPRISTRPAPSSILVQPMQPSAPGKPAQPLAPATTIRATQPQRALPSALVTAERTISVRPGDSLWKLAQQNLGSGSRWPEIVAANPRIADPNQIRAGAQLILPAVATTNPQRNARSDAATRSIKVRKGDTLWTLAKTSLGHSSAWPCLATANPSIADPNRIYENQKLIVPAACTP